MDEGGRRQKNPQNTISGSKDSENLFDTICVTVADGTMPSVGYDEDSDNDPNFR